MYLPVSGPAGSREEEEGGLNVLVRRNRTFLTRLLLGLPAHRRLAGLGRDQTDSRPVDGPLLGREGMKERPILFKGEMVTAILEGRKTMTRRPMKPQPFQITPGDTPMGARFMGWYEGGTCSDLWCPYGQPGDRLWVRETWQLEFHYGFHDVRYLADNYLWDPGTLYLNLRNRTCWKKRPSIFMPRWASRITLEITDIRVERVQEITEEDAIKEGILSQMGDGSGPGPGYKWEGIGYHGAGFDKAGRRTFHTPSRTGKCKCFTGGDSPAQCAFREIWDSIHGRGAWERNDWVWAISFRRI